jgi:hypothetical protein
MDEKSTKAEAKYRNGHGSKICENCTMFVPDERECTSVEGYIDPLALCDYFERKK